MNWRCLCSGATELPPRRRLGPVASHCSAFAPPLRRERGGAWSSGGGAALRGTPEPTCLTLGACVRRGGRRGLRAGRRALQQRPVLPAQLQVQLHVRGRRGGLHAALPPRAPPTRLVPPRPAGERARALLRAVGVRRRRQEATQDRAAPHGRLRWVLHAGRGAQGAGGESRPWGPGVWGRTLPKL